MFNFCHQLITSNLDWSSLLSWFLPLGHPELWGKYLLLFWLWLFLLQISSLIIFFSSPIVSNIRPISIFFRALNNLHPPYCSILFVFTHFFFHSSPATWLTFSSYSLLLSFLYLLLFFPEKLSLETECKEVFY